MPYAVPRHKPAAYMTPELRQRMSELAKRRWAEGKHDSLRKHVDRPMSCRFCGGPFTRKSRNRILGKRFCSQACQRKHLTKLAKERQRSIVCRHCGKIFVLPFQTCRSPKFCSRECRFAATPRQALVKITCLCCGQTRQRRAVDVKRAKRHFCSTECREKYIRGAEATWYRGKHDYRRGAAWEELAKTIRDRDGLRCRRCGRSRTLFEKKFPVDHVIPWRTFVDKAEANHPSNLVTLCHNCHSYKTTFAERRWLLGDAMALLQFKKDVGLV